MTGEAMIYCLFYLACALVSGIVVGWTLRELKEISKQHAEIEARIERIKKG